VSEYSPGYPVNTNPGPAGDTVKEAVDKHIAEFLKSYADLTTMYQQILTELKYADVDMVDGRHADNTANNIPLLNGVGQLTNDIENTSVKTGSMEVSGAAKVKSLTVNGVDIGSFISSRIAVKTGVVAHGDSIPLPTGFTQAECFWTVSMRRLNSGKYSDESVWADENRVVTCMDASNGGGTANYIIIGIKSS
jgi:hypothetical protein